MRQDPRHGPHIGLTVAADIRLIMDAAQGNSGQLPIEALCNADGNGGLSNARGLNGLGAVELFQRHDAEQVVGKCHVGDGQAKVRLLLETFAHPLGAADDKAGGAFSRELHLAQRPAVSLRMEMAIGFAATANSPRSAVGGVAAPGIFNNATLIKHDLVLLTLPSASAIIQDS